MASRGALQNILRDSRLSEFRRRVYIAVLGIPKGRTRSYKWVAERSGRPLAARAVGNALNKNPYPGIVPCHRVVKSDGSIGGFFKGPEAKRKMLKREGVDLRGMRLL